MANVIQMTTDEQVPTTGSPTTDLNFKLDLKATQAQAQ